MSKNPNWGGKRPGAGRKNRRHLTLKPEVAKSLYILTKHRRVLYQKPELTEEDVISSLIEAAWHELDQYYQEAAEEAQEPYIL